MLLLATSFEPRSPGPVNLTSPFNSVKIVSMEIERNDLDTRSRVHAALGEPHRLAIVDALRWSDRTPSQLQELTGLGSNLLTFHLDVLDEAGLVVRRRSEGDARRRYVSLRWEGLTTDPPAFTVSGPVLFVCTRNAARSQLAAALWAERTGTSARSAGTEPAAQIDPMAREVARDHGLQMSEVLPRHYREVDEEPALVVSVCDRAREGGLPWSVRALHWSVPDPVGGTRDQYELAYLDLERRIGHLATAAA